MTLSYFIPNSTLGIAFVIGLLVWFVLWFGRLTKEADMLKASKASFDVLTACIPPLRQHQAWRDKERLSGKVATVNPSQVFTDVLKAQMGQQHVSPPEPIRTHFEAIFLAGCDESSLDLAELSGSTVQTLTRMSQALRLELLLCVLTGIVGTLLAIAQATTAVSAVRPLGPSNAFAPAIWSFLLALTGGVLYLRFQATVQTPVLAALRKITTTIWVPRLYPTVAQRAAHWAVQTLQNAARVTDASEVIDQNTTRFAASITDARKTAELFSQGMRDFAKGIEGSDQAIMRAQTKLAETVDKFAQSLTRWTNFEDEIRTFYRSADAHQKQLVKEQENLEYMLAAYKDMVAKATATLQQSAEQIAATARQLPQSFDSVSSRIEQTATSFSYSTNHLISDLAHQLTVQTAEIKSSHLGDLAKFEESLAALTNPIQRLEERLRDLSTPFERAAHNFQEIATNLWKLNEAAMLNIHSQLDQLKGPSGKDNLPGLHE